MIKIVTLFIGATLLNVVNAECPNACSSHGRCSSYDMCLCYRNWMSNDCSERVCQFGLAHVDSPKGDLDASSGVLAGPETTVITNNEVYPWGTTEQYPQMTDSNGTVLENTGHYYMECSNKGICDRSSGLCECFPGYEGSACQRASCPSNDNGVCSGHGTCQSIRELAAADYGNIYELWDKDATLGCDCDAGYYGADCSLRQCKFGADPLYYDDNKATKRVANWTYGFHTSVDAEASIYGNYSIHFYDVFGEDWETEFIDANATCADIIDRLEGLPNDVIPYNSVECLIQDPQAIDYLNDGSITSSWASRLVVRMITIVFPENVGILRQPSIDLYLDGARPTLVSTNRNETLTPFIFADGFHGEYEDLVPDLCEGITVTLETDTDGTYLGLDSNHDIKVLKRCLGDSDWDSSTNIDTYNWDVGSDAYPHLIKLTDVSDNHYSRICNSTDTVHPATGLTGWCDNYNPAGFYAPLRYQDLGQGDRFYVYSVPDLDYPVDSFGKKTYFNVFTTTGRLSRRGYDSVDNADQAFKDWQFNNLFGNTLYSVYPRGTGKNFFGSDSLDCETSRNHTQCIEKGDRVLLFYIDDANDEDPKYNNFRYHNIYTVEKISFNYEEYRTEVVLDMGTNIPMMNKFFIYKFEKGNTAKWAAECSDRGVCDSSSGLCQCFPGYTSDDCSVQNTLAH